MERYIRNPHGITIRCCCATCQHKTLDRGDDARRCQKLLKPDLPTCPGYDPLGPQADRPQGHTLLHADSRTEREQEERDRQEVEAVGETYYGGLRVGLCEVFTPENVRQAIRCASEREAAAYLGEVIRRHFDKKRRNTPQSEENEAGR